MENVARYREIIHRLLEEYRAFLTELTKTEVDTEVLCDDRHGMVTEVITSATVAPPTKTRQTS